MFNNDTVECDIAVIGGGFGGVAAALSACESGASVVLTEASDWLGGQVTSQLVAALDEHEYIEHFGGTRSYYRFRNSVRAYYEQKFGRKVQNPGAGWVSNLCFEPLVGLRVIHDLLEPYLLDGKLKVHYQLTPISVTVDGNRILSVTCVSPDGKSRTIRARYFLDATELGDLIELAGAPYTCGAEAVEDTGEADASKDGPHPHQVQAFTSCFILGNCPGVDNTLRKPQNYEMWRDSQPFRLDVPGETGGAPIHYNVFTPSAPDENTFWTYRRILCADAFPQGQVKQDLALINWDSNDYRGGDLIGAAPQEKQRLLREAKSLSAAFLYYLQTEVPRDDGEGYGYPELRLVTTAAGSADGFGKMPYIRESRRLRGRVRIVESDICENKENPGARAKPFMDSVGIGFYPVDVHACCNGPMPNYHFPHSLPYQIPLGALICGELSNLIAAAKNISTTHITNGAYRLHPVEWNIGESAASLAVYCLNKHLDPCQVHADTKALHAFQQTLLQRGIPLAWELDAGTEEEAFTALQTCLTYAPLKTGRRAQSLSLFPDEPISQGELSAILSCLPESPRSFAPPEAADLPAAVPWVKSIFAQMDLPVAGLSDPLTYSRAAKLLLPYLQEH
jgi:hypothetical protein